MPVLVIAPGILYHVSVTASAPCKRSFPTGVRSHWRSVIGDGGCPHPVEICSRPPGSRLVANGLYQPGAACALSSPYTAVPETVAPFCVSRRRAGWVIPGESDGTHSVYPPETEQLETVNVPCHRPWRDVPDGPVGSLERHAITRNTTIARAARAEIAKTVLQPGPTAATRPVRPCRPPAHLATCRHGTFP